MNEPKETPKQLDLEQVIKEIEEHKKHPKELDMSKYNLTELTTFKLSKDDVEKLNDTAKDMNMSTSKFIRYCLFNADAIYSIH